MANKVSDIDINKISSLAYVGVVDNEDSAIYNEYRQNKGKIDVGTVIDYCFIIQQSLSICNQMIHQQIPLVIIPIFY